MTNQLRPVVLTSAEEDLLAKAYLPNAHPSGSLHEAVKEACETIVNHRLHHHQAHIAADEKAVMDFVQHVASNCAYNGADNPGQMFYDEGLNPWLFDAAYNYNAGKRP